MQPILPMEPKRSEAIPHGPEWIAQVKWDGVRILTYKEGQYTHLFNRRLRERTRHYPELTAITSYCEADSVILDGEVIALGSDGKPDFHEVMKRDALRRTDRVPQVQKRIPIVYMIFDVLYYNGQWLTQDPLSARLDILDRLIRPSSTIQVVSSHDSGDALFQAIQAHGMEGIVCKHTGSRYYIGEKRDVWLKVKNYRDLIAAIGGFTLNDAETVNAVLLGLYDDEGRFWYIGHAGAAKFSASEWRQLTSLLAQDVIAKRPFVNAPERLSGAHWVQPKLAVKIKYMEWTAGKAVRQPSIEGIVRVPVSECRLDADMHR